MRHFIKGKVHFWPSNYHRSSILVIQLQKLDILEHQAIKIVYIWSPDGFAGWLE